VAQERVERAPILLWSTVSYRLPAATAARSRPLRRSDRGGSHPVENLERHVISLDRADLLGT